MKAPGRSGEARIVYGEAERQAALRLLCEKYDPGRSAAEVDDLSESPQQKRRRRPDGCGIHLGQSLPLTGSRAAEK